MVFAMTMAALQACLVGLLGVEALQWSKVCNIYTRFCEQVAAGLVCSLLAAVGMAVLSAFSARDLFRGPCSSSARQCAQL
uniref:CASP-like protein n=1 Tax=Arundo donax TaxID=35708 RepID=A0A0A8XPB1_ARUDO